MKYNIGDIIVMLNHQDCNLHSIVTLINYKESHIKDDFEWGLYTAIVGNHDFPDMYLYEYDIEYSIENGDYLYFPVIKND